MVSIVKKFAASDGTEFNTRAEAVAHDADVEFDALIGLTADDVAAALTGKNPRLGDLIEKAASRIARQRRESGDLKRNVKPRGAPKSATEEKKAP